MTDYAGRLRAPPEGRVALLVARYNQVITAKLLEGALACCDGAGLKQDDLDIVWVPGAFELGVAAACAADTGRYACLVALGAVIRGETPHFEYVAGEAARGLTMVAVTRGIPVGFGLLTVDTMEQGMARAGGTAGNKGYEAAEAALRTADAIANLRQG